MKRILFVGLLAALVFPLATPVLAEDYPEVPATSRYYPGGVFIYGLVIGSVFPTQDTDPTCNELTAICRRICGDLAPGAKFGSHAVGGIDPPYYARFVEPIEVYQNKVVRVCMRVKNWGTGTPKTFSVSVAYAAANKSEPSAPGVNNVDLAAQSESEAYAVPDEVSATSRVDMGHSQEVSANS